MQPQTTLKLAEETGNIIAVRRRAATWSRSTS